jgi:fucose 4-O-acetylase-like acetyltransferase
VTVQNRLEYVDIAKGIGIVLVVCSHSDALGLMWLMMGMFVPIFYFCSGYTYSMKGTLTECMKKRFRKLFVPYLFFNLLMFCAFMHFSLRELVGVFYSRYSLYPLDVTPNIKFLTSGNYPMWFLTSMIVSYFFFYLLVYFDRFKYGLFAVYAILTIALDRLPILLPWSLDTAFLTSLFMYAGMVARNKDYISANWWQVGIVLSVYVGLHLIGGDINLSVRMYGTSVFIYFILGCLGSFVVLWGSKFLEGTILGRLFLSLGQHSLTIFCIQMIFIVWAKNMYHFFFPQLAIDYVAGLFEILFSLVGGWLFSVLLHKNKYISGFIF